MEHHFCESASLHLRVYHAAVDAISKVVQRGKGGGGRGKRKKRSRYFHPKETTMTVASSNGVIFRESPPSSDLPFRLSPTPLCNSAPRHSIPLPLCEMPSITLKASPQRRNASLSLPPSQVEQSDADGGGTNRLDTGGIGDTVANLSICFALGQTILTKYQLNHLFILIS